MTTMTNTFPLHWRTGVNRLGTSNVHKLVGRVHKCELSPLVFSHPYPTVDSCVQHGAGQKGIDAGTMLSHPQSTALITRTILKDEFLMSITSHDVGRDIDDDIDKGRSA